MSPSPALSVVTVSWNSRLFLEECVRSVRESAGPMSCEHIVVDNASADGAADEVERNFPDVRVVRNSANLGFGRANNMGAALARGRLVLFLNPDSRVLADGLQRMTAVMDDHPEVGVLGPRLLDEHLRLRRDMGYRMPSLRTVINEFLGISRLLPFPQLLPGIMNNGDFEGLEDREWVSGAAFMVRREVLEQELWNEEIFFHGEDIEYCDRIRRRGWRACATGDAGIIHFSGQSMTKQSGEFLAGKRSGIAVYLEQNHGPRTAWTAVQIMRLGYFMRSLLHRIRYRLSGNVVSLQHARRLHQYVGLDDGHDTKTRR